MTVPAGLAPLSPAQAIVDAGKAILVDIRAADGHAKLSIGGAGARNAPGGGLSTRMAAGLPTARTALAAAPAPA